MPQNQDLKLPKEEMDFDDLVSNNGIDPNRKKSTVTTKKAVKKIVIETKRKTSAQISGYELFDHLFKASKQEAMDGQGPELS